jgi:hypothetical protein
MTGFGLPSCSAQMQVVHYIRTRCQQESLVLPITLVRAIQMYALPPSCRLSSEAYLNQPPGPGRYRVAACRCNAQACTLDCPAGEGEGGGAWQEALLSIDETGLTLAGGPGVAAWRERGGLLVLDFLSNSQA